jgi:hypothetical protein
MVKASSKRNKKTFMNVKNKTLKDYKNNSLPIIKNFQKEITLVFLEVLLMIKLFHWKTKSYPTHKATDELYEKFNGNMDRFIEVLLGKTDTRIEMTNKKNFKLIDCNSKLELINHMNNFKKYLVNLDTNKAIDSMRNSDLFTIRDEILADVNQFLYLLTFQ